MIETMTDSEEKKIFSRNLTLLVHESGKMQKDIAKDLGVPLQTFNGWCKGVSIPSMAKVQKIADYFKVGKTDLLDERVNVDSATVNQMFEYLAKTKYPPKKGNKQFDFIISLSEDEDLRLLVEVAKNSSKEDVEMAINLLRRLKK